MKKKVLITALSIFLLFALFPCLFGLLHIRKLKNDLSNPIISSGYQGWHSVSLDDNIEVKLPNTWSLHLEDPLAIYDSEGRTVAIGMKCESCSDEQWMELLGNCSDRTVISYENAFFSSNRFGNLASVWLAVCEFESGQKGNVVSLKIPYYYDYKYYFCFADDIEIRYIESEAIAYSMAYSK